MHRLFKLFLALILLAACTSPAFAQQAGGVSLTVVVRDEFGYPIEAAEVQVEPLGWQALTDASGRAVWQGIVMDQAYAVTKITVKAASYGDWTYYDVRLIEGEDLLLTPFLRADPTTVTIPRPEYAWFSEPNFDDYAGLQQIFRSIDLSSPMPETLRLRITENPLVCDPDAAYTIQTVPFIEYVRNVLPNEWAAEWNAESLKAGAVAVKMYAWYWIARGGKWGDADLMDSTCDQVYLPNSSHPYTDEAIRLTWGYRMERAGDLFQPQHLRICSLPSCMDQDQSVRMANQGYTWQELLAHFYPGSRLDDEGYPYTLYTYLPVVLHRDRR